VSHTHDPLLTGSIAAHVFFGGAFFGAFFGVFFGPVFFGAVPGCAVDVTPALALAASC